MQTVVGLYKTVSEANKVKQALLGEGYSGGDVTVIDQSESGSTTGYEGTTGYGATGDTGDSVGSKIKHFFQGLGGHDEHTHSAYTEGVRGGGALVAVNAAEGQVERTAALLEQYGASDIDGGGTYGSSTGDTLATTGTDRSASTVTGEQVIPIVQEELVVGKRQVERGGVRVYSRVVSEAVSENVNLHDERVVVDRHAVSRAATEADFVDAGPIEVRAMGEEAVVGKAGRVVEEVVVGKTASDHSETVKDSVRHTEVDVEPVTTGVGSTTTTTNTKY